MRDSTVSSCLVANVVQFSYSQHCVCLIQPDGIEAEVWKSLGEKAYICCWIGYGRFF